MSDLALCVCGHPRSPHHEWIFPGNPELVIGQCWHQHDIYPADDCHCPTFKAAGTTRPSDAEVAAANRPPGWISLDAAHRALDLLAEKQRRDDLHDYQRRTRTEIDTARASANHVHDSLARAVEAHEHADAMYEAQRNRFTPDVKPGRDRVTTEAAGWSPEDFATWPEVQCLANQIADTDETSAP